MAEALHCAADGPPERRSGGGDRALLALLFLPFALGLVFFGAVRIWAIGPLALGIFAALFLFCARRPRTPWVRVPPGAPALGLFLLYALVQAGRFAAVPWDARVKAVMVASVAAALLMWTALAGRGGRWRTLYGLALALVAAVALYAVIQHHRGSRMVLYLERPIGYGWRASGTHFCPNHFANLVAMGICLSLSLLANPEAGRPLKALSGALLLFLPYPLLLSQSRSGVLGVLAGAGTLALLTAWRRGRRVLAAALLAAPLLLGAAGWAAWQYGPQMKERVRDAVAGLESREDWRILAWQGTLDMIRDRPLWGHGGGSYRHVEPMYQRYYWNQAAVYAHQEFLQALAEYGAAGFALLAAFAAAVLFRLLLRVRRSPRPRNAMLAAGCLSVAACALVHALFDFNFHIYANSLFLALVGGAAFACLFEDREWEPRPVPPRRMAALRAAGALAALALFAIMFRSGLSYGICFPAESALAGRRYEEAERRFRQALRVDPSYGRARVGLGRVLLERALSAPRARRPPLLLEAREAYRAGLERNPYAVEGWYGASQVYSLLGDEDRALDALRQMVRLYPLFPHYQDRVGVQLYRMGRLEEAREVFEGVLRIRGADPGTARLHLREIHRRLKDPP